MLTPDLRFPCVISSVILRITAHNETDQGLNRSQANTYLKLTTNLARVTSHSTVSVTLRIAYLLLVSNGVFCKSWQT